MLVSTAKHKTGSHKSGMVSHVQLGRLRCGKGPSSHVSSPVTGQCPKIELFYSDCNRAVHEIPVVALSEISLTYQQSIQFDEIVAEPDQMVLLDIVGVVGGAVRDPLGGGVRIQQLLQRLVHAAVDQNRNILPHYKTLLNSKQKQQNKKNFKSHVQGI
ncbi:conserved hypothetical protein [Trichinella spiralis]|uniref:hypothetical protein n=1 Tax=Trichinella spiralis TaxID=6334 RepID=UPI0001EFD84F|nr:conserved hypothetical protein [Trichinella spiralis]